MTELILQIEFNGEKQLLQIDPSSQSKYFFNLLREAFKKKYPLITNKKLIIFYGAPLLKLYEHNINPENTLADLQLANNAILRIEIDDENYITETLMQNPYIIVAQQKELEKYAEKKNNENSAENAKDNLKLNNNVAKAIPEISSVSKEEKKEEGNFSF